MIGFYSFCGFRFSWEILIRVWSSNLETFFMKFCFNQVCVFYNFLLQN